MLFCPPYASDLFQSLELHPTSHQRHGRISSALYCPPSTPPRLKIPRSLYSNLPFYTLFRPRAHVPGSDYTKSSGLIFCPCSFGVSCLRILSPCLFCQLPFTPSDSMLPVSFAFLLVSACFLSCCGCLSSHDLPFVVGSMYIYFRWWRVVMVLTQIV